MLCVQLGEIYRDERLVQGVQLPDGFAECTRLSRACANSSC